MSKGKIEITNWFICDDVRQEVGGKTSFIGVYGDDVVVNHIPTKLPQLCFVLNMAYKPGIAKEITFRVAYPKMGDGVKHLGPVKIKVPQEKKQKKIGAIFGFAPFEFLATGVYEIFLAIDDESENKIGSFEVKLL